MTTIAPATDDEVVWDYSREEARTRAKWAFPAGVVLLAAYGWREPALAIGGGALLALGLGLFLVLWKGRTWRVSARGLTIERPGKRPVFHPWSEFESFRLSTDVNRSRRTADLAEEARERFGESYYLRPRNPWRLETWLIVEPEVAARVDALVRAALPYRPHAGGTRGTYVIAGVVVALVIAIVIAVAILTA